MNRSDWQTPEQSAATNVKALYGALNSAVQEVDGESPQPNSIDMANLPDFNHAYDVASLGVVYVTVPMSEANPNNVHMNWTMSPQPSTTPSAYQGQLNAAVLQSIQSAVPVIPQLPLPEITIAPSPDAQQTDSTDQSNDAAAQLDATVRQSIQSATPVIPQLPLPDITIAPAPDVSPGATNTPINWTQIFGNNTQSTAPTAAAIFGSPKTPQQQLDAAVKNFNDINAGRIPGTGEDSLNLRNNIADLQNKLYPGQSHLMPGYSTQENDALASRAAATAQNQQSLVNSLLASSGGWGSIGEALHAPVQTQDQLNGVAAGVTATIGGLAFGTASGQNIPVADAPTITGGPNTYYVNSTIAAESAAAGGVPVPRVDVSDKFTISPAYGNGKIDVDYLDAEFGPHGLNATIDANGSLSFEVRAQGDVLQFGSDTDMFSSMMLRLNSEGIQVNQITGTWISDPMNEGGSAKRAN